MALSARLKTPADLLDFLKWCKKNGYSVGENLAYGRVSPVHMKNSFHYDSSKVGGVTVSHAADINYGSNGAVERAKLLTAMNEARYRGLSVIFAAEGKVGSAAAHQTHLHVDIGSWSNIGRGDIRTVTVKRPSVISKVVRKSIKRGDTGSVVRRFQAYMNKVYPLYSKLAEDGIFGKETDKVAREWQRRMGFKATGTITSGQRKLLGI